MWNFQHYLNKYPNLTLKSHKLEACESYKKKILGILETNRKANATIRKRHTQNFIEFLDKLREYREKEYQKYIRDMEALDKLMMIDLEKSEFKDLKKTVAWNKEKQQLRQNYQTILYKLDQSEKNGINDLKNQLEEISVLERQDEKRYSCEIANVEQYQSYVELF